jgi:CRISPR/Cas system-associated exonuclease Cas4 (RecB family)
MFNHSRSSTSGTGRKKVLNLNGKQKEKLQPFQVYSQLYYESKWKATLDAEYQVYKQTEPEPGKKLKQPFQYSMDRLRELYEAETQEIKNEVEERRKQMVDSPEEAPKEKLLRYQR